ncbi:MAG TPA: bifunctional glutamate N-acetyltransferase/amino-acid acetyltransferase ArgJ, partial [Candidatus Polarisedimenticolia bacterium]|nr:bifunctional glutamate N-acetyltransferase/amino-acid acetyltransferase ArgJ [Candidatus Polarisedimenticolia bacterium]
QNRFQAAPVVLSRAALKRSGGRVACVVVNAGCANAVTGRAGLDAARRVRSRAAELVGCPAEQVFLASTGVIGVILPDAKIRATLPASVMRLSVSGLTAASQAILTTDVGPKVAQRTYRWAGRRGRIVGFAKGAGMIHPNMATMLAFIMTDAPATPAFLKTALKEASDHSFNTISVDGDTSTNDTVLVMASGRLGGPKMVSPAAAGARSFRRALDEVCRDLALMIVRDGEGATRLMEIQVRGARTAREAQLAAHAVATSPLVKTALFSGDPNWGRILATVGRSGARFSPRRVSLSVGDLTLVSGGSPVAYRESDAARRFSRERVQVTIDLGAGRAIASRITCDLGHDYVSLNADYRS